MNVHDLRFGSPPEEDARGRCPSVLRTTPVPVVQVHALLDPRERSQLIESVRPLMRTSALSGSTGRLLLDREQRRSQTYKYDTNPKIMARIAAHLGVHETDLNGTNIVRYGPGDFFAPHVDPLRRGHLQRTSTAIIALTDDFRGGALEFPRLGTAYRVSAGAGIFFENLDCDGAGIPEALHAGGVVESGEKWVMVFWSSLRLAQHLIGSLGDPDIVETKSSKPNGG